MVATHTLHKLALESSRFFASRADLLPNYLSQLLIDSVLPARSGQSVSGQVLGQSYQSVQIKQDVSVLMMSTTN
jgi:hypothetical protein